DHSQFERHYFECITSQIGLNGGQDVCKTYYSIYSLLTYQRSEILYYQNKYLPTLVSFGYKRIDQWLLRVNIPVNKFKHSQYHRQSLYSTSEHIPQQILNEWDLPGSYHGLLYF